MHLTSFRENTKVRERERERERECVCVCERMSVAADAVDEYYKDAAAGRITPPCCVLYIVSPSPTISL